MVAIPTNAFYGAKAPIPISGVNGIWLPHWATIDTAVGITTTATRLYYIPYYFPVTNLSYTGLKTRNTGAGDNGEVYRVGVYQASFTTGLPSTLVADVGEVTLTGAAATRTTASSWTAPYVGWGFLCLHANTACALQALSNVNSGGSAAGYVANTLARTMFPTSDIDATTNAINAGTFAAYYVDTAYGALASTAVAPTAFTNLAPIVAPYRT